MKNLKTILITAGGLVLLLAGTTFLPQKKNAKIIKETPVEIKYTNEEQIEIKFFNERIRLISSSYAADEPYLIEPSVREMMEKYPNLNPRIQSAVRPALEDGLFFLNGLSRGYVSNIDYQTRAIELGLNIKNIENKK